MVGAITRWGKRERENNRRAQKGQGRCSSKIFGARGRSATPFRPEGVGCGPWVPEGIGVGDGWEALFSVGTQKKKK